MRLFVVGHLGCDVVFRGPGRIKTECVNDISMK